MMVGLETALALTAILGVFGVGAEMLVRSAGRLLAVCAGGKSTRTTVEVDGLGLLGNLAWLTLGLVVFQEGVWLAYLFLR